MSRFLAIAVLCAACTPDVGADRVRRSDRDSEPTPTVSTSGSGWTTTDPDTLDCSFEPPAPVSITEYPIGTQEDFAFDGLGRMVYQSGSAIVASGPGGGVQPVGAGPADPSGLAMVSRSELAIASPDSGSVVLLDLLGSGSYVVAGGLEQPNGLTTGWDGRIYVSERTAGRVRWVDPVDGRTEVVAEGLERPNGLALDADEGVIYIAAEDGVYAVDRLDDDWVRVAEPRLVHPFGAATFVGTVAVDRCGYVYTIGYADGELLKIDPDTDETLLIADLDAGASFGFGALEFGNGGGWSRSVLFTSNRRVVSGVDVGIPGVLAPSAY